MTAEPIPFFIQMFNLLLQLFGAAFTAVWVSGVIYGLVYVWRQPMQDKTAAQMFSIITLIFWVAFHFS